MGLSHELSNYDVALHYWIFLMFVDSINLFVHEYSMEFCDCDSWVIYMEVV